jgi:hypothetical protein
MARRRRSQSSAKKVRKALRKIKPFWILKIFLYALGIVSFLYCQREYPTALISFKMVLIIGIATGIIASLIIEREYKYYLFSVILLGSLCMAILFKLNRTFVHKKEETFKLIIVNKSLRSAKQEHSIVTVYFDDFSRDIIVDGFQEDLLAPAHKLILTVRKGGLGYYIITDKRLSPD